VHEVKFSPDGRWLATFIRGIFSGKSIEWEEKLLRLWKVDNGQTMPLELIGYIKNFAFTADGDRLATAEGAYGARIWSVASGEELLRLPHKYPVRFVAFSPNGKIIATLSTGFWGQPLRFWDPTSGKRLGQLRSSVERDAIRRAVFSPDWRYVAIHTNKQYNEVQIFDVETLEKIRSLVHQNGIGDIVFSPDGRYIATESGGQEGSPVIIWDWLQSRPLIQLNTTSTYDIKFTPDGSRVITAGRTVQVWHWRAEDLVADACARLERNFTRKEWRTYFGGEDYRRTCPELPAPEK
jgi:WD40 repeat protein